MSSIGKVVICLLALVAPWSMASAQDWALYEKVLQRHVTQGSINQTPLTIVNYSALKADADFANVVDQLAAVDVASLRSREETLAFYINAYNILAMKMVVDHWPVQSIRDIGNWFSSVWKKTAGRIGGREVTLDYIEHDILRKLGEPRIHFAIVCASVSCPDLLNEPYRADRLDTQLDGQVKSFLYNPAKGLRVDGDKIRVSKIFAWFGEDFESGGGVASFVRQQRTDLPSYPIEADIGYDWALNGR